MTQVVDKETRDNWPRSSGVLLVRKQFQTDVGVKEQNSSTPEAGFQL